MRALGQSRRRLVVAAGALVLVAAAVPAAFALLGGDEEKPRHAVGHQAPAADDPHPVAGHFKVDDTQLSECTPEKPRCYEQAFGNLAFNEGPQAALASFDQAIASEPTVESNCHRIAHTIGSAALARFDGDVPKAFAAGSSSCWSGYYHGILERAFTGVSTGAELTAAARAVCDDEEIRRTTFLAYQCVHGLGHGLMIRSGYDLPDSLGVCDRLVTEWDQTSCTGGVFMENIASTYGVRSRWLRDDDPVYPCQVMKERHKLYCYLMVTSRVNELNGYRWVDTAEVCRTVERDWVTTCFESYGRDASGFTRQSPEEVARICEYAKRHAASCVYGAARDMTSNYANGRRASELCRLVPARLHERCFYGIGTILGNLSATEEGRKAACRDAAAAEYMQACLEGSGVRLSGVLESTS